MGTVVQAAAFGEQITDDLRLRIATSDLAPGTHLVEGRLAVEYDVSRAPVREALRQLRVEGLVEARKRGVFVTGLSAEDVAELTELRSAIETLAVRRAKAHATAADWDGLVTTVEKMRAAAAADDIQAFTEADMEFHTAFYVASGSRRLLDVWTTYSTSIATLLRLSKKTHEDLVDGVEAHESLLATVRFGEADIALVAVEEHLQGTQRLLAEVVNRPNVRQREETQ